MDKIGDKITSKNIQNFSCEICDFKCCKKGDWNRHITTPKHKNLTLSNSFYIKNIHSCNICNKNYSSRNGLWNHKKKCQPTNEINANNIDLTDSKVILHLIQQNSDFKQLILDQNKTIVDQNNKIFEICKNGTTNTNIHNINSHNKTFNLNVFLNETCKDAMNIMDFVDSIKLQISDLEGVGEKGYVEGISNIITSNLKALDVSLRPIHCTDKKREVLYIKDENKWEKEDEDKKKLRKAIKRVATKNQRLLPVYKEEHPDCVKSTSPFSDQYNKMIIESMGGLGNNDLEKEDKIIRNISKNVVINKDNY
jgi:hypothetical protein